MIATITLHGGAHDGATMTATCGPDFKPPPTVRAVDVTSHLTLVLEDTDEPPAANPNTTTYHRHRVRADGSWIYELAR